MKTRKFNLQDAINGYLVCTNHDGYKVMILNFYAQSEYPFIGYVDLGNGYISPEAWDCNGKHYNREGDIENMDLLIIDNSDEKWLNINRIQDYLYPGDTLYLTEKEAKDNICSKTHYKTIKIEV